MTPAPVRTGLRPVQDILADCCRTLSTAPPSFHRLSCPFCPCAIPREVRPQEATPVGDSNFAASTNQPAWGRKAAKPLALLGAEGPDDSGQRRDGQGSCGVRARLSRGGPLIGHVSDSLWLRHLRTPFRHVSCACGSNRQAAPEQKIILGVCAREAWAGATKRSSQSWIHERRPSTCDLRA